MKFRTKENHSGQKQNGPRLFECDYCEKSFGRRYHLQYHIFTHTGERPFQCDLCDKKYNSYNNLKQHMKLHGKVKCYECKKCDQSFQSLKELVKHENKHNDIYYHCKNCVKTFSTRTLYLRHGCPFECENCGKTFKHYMALISHKGKEHMTVNTSKTFHIDRNDGATNSLNEVLEDSNEQLEVFRGNKPHVCRLCGKEFNDEISLIFHVRIHGDGDPCECMVCGLTFPSETIRTYHHMSVHTGGIDWQNIESGRKIFKQVYHELDRNY